MKPIMKISLFAIALCVAPITSADELGRLFFTPEQRARLDIEHARQIDPAESANSLSVSGIVQRHGGDRIVWINGVPQVAGKSDEQAPASVPVAVPGQSQPVRVKVGQSIILNPAPAKK